MSRILLLEDDLSLVNGLTYTFHKQGFELDVARTILEADALWQDSRYDLLVLDVSLPDGTGFDFCKRVRRISRVPILFLTASDEEMSIIMGLDISGDDYITKPFKLGVLMSRINALLRRAKGFEEVDTELQSNGIRVLLLQGQALLRYAVGGEFLTIPQLAVSPIGIGFGIATGLLSVLLAARAPAKRAARVSPVAAVRGIDESGSASGRAIPTFNRRIDTALGVCHAAGSKKTLLLMTASFALSILLFLAFSVVISFTHHALIPLRPYAPDLEIMNNNHEGAIDSALAARIREVHGVEHVYGRCFAGQVPVQGQPKISTVDIISYEQLQMEWAKQDVVKGDIGKLSQDGSYVMTVFDKHSALSEPLEVGDRFQVNGIEVEVVCILSDSPFDSDGTPTILCNEQTFARLFGPRGYAVIDIQTTDEFTDGDAETIRQLAGEGVSLSDRRSSNREVTATYWAFSILVYSFLLIVAMITVFHIMNSISMSVSARVREYGAMRAVGMDKWQLTRMIAAEAMTYALCGCLVGCSAGIPLHRFFYQKMISDYWGELWRLPVIPLAVVLALVLLTVLLAVISPVKRICDTPITAAINEL